jgi:hypothetical protein
MSLMKPAIPARWARSLNPTARTAPRHRCESGRDNPADDHNNREMMTRNCSSRSTSAAIEVMILDPNQ